MSTKGKELEKHVKAGVRAMLLKNFPRMWEVMVVPTGYGVKGIPDHVACVPIVITPDMVGRTMGMFLAVESKTKKGETSPLQEVQIAKIKRAHGYCDVVFGTADIERLEQDILRHYEIL